MMSIYTVRLKIYTLLLALLLVAGFPNDAYGLFWKYPPETFSTGDATSLGLAGDLNGNGFTIWGQNTQTELYVSRFSNADQSYGPYILIATAATVIYSPFVATDATGTALICWEDADTYEILTSFYDGSIWSTPSPSPLDVLTSGFIFPNITVAMDGSGNGLAGWASGVESSTAVEVNVSFFDGGTQTWGTVQTITAGGSGIGPVVDFSSNGTAVALWTNLSHQVIASNYDGVSWAAPTTIGTNGQFFINAPTVAIDAAGNALAVWQNSATLEVLSCYYTGGIWGAPQSVSLAPVPSGQIAFAMSDAGNALAAWTDGTSGQLYSSFIGGTWSAPATLSADASRVTIALDTHGKGLFAIAQSSTSNMYSILLPFGGPLGPEEFIAFSGQLTPVFAALGNNRRGLVSGNMEGEAANGASGTYTFFPEIFGVACTDPNAELLDRVHTIIWNPSSDPNTVAYYLRRNGVIISSILATDPLIYYDYNRPGNVPDEYLITSVDVNGVESNPQYIALQ